MKNADKPAMPVPLASVPDGSIYSSMEVTSGELCGLTKREHFALEIFKSLQINAGRNGYHLGADKNCIDDAIRAADAMLDALSKEVSA